MYPTLQESDYLLGLRHPATLDYGDIIMIWAPDRDDGIIYVKRIVATDGDVISISDTNRIIITTTNGTVVLTPYEVSINQISNYPLQLQDGEIYVIGDNHMVSNDSRSFGVVTQDKVIAKSILQIHDNVITQIVAKIRFFHFA